MATCRVALRRLHVPPSHRHEGASDRREFPCLWSGHCDATTTAVAPPSVFSMLALAPGAFVRLVTAPLSATGGDGAGTAVRPAGVAGVDSGSHTQCVVRLVPGTCDEATLLVPPQVLLNLGLARSATGTVVTATAAVAPPSAAHAVLAPVAGSCKYDAGLWDEALRRHFAVPRVLRCGDLCGVLVASDSHGRAAPPPDDAACVQSHSVGAATTCTDAGGTSAVAALYEAATTRYTVAVFRVEKLRLSPDTPGDASCERWAMVHAASTAVVQAAPVHTLCPCPGQLLRFLAPPVAAVGDGPGDATPLPAVAAELEALLQPCVEPRPGGGGGGGGGDATPRASVALFGARGCGKRQLVRAVAHRLGLHFVELNWHTLTRRSDALTAESVESAVGAACEASYPCIVLLRRVMVADGGGDGGGEDGSGNGGAGVAPAAVALRRCFDRIAGRTALGAWGTGGTSHTTATGAQQRDGSVSDADDDELSVSSGDDEDFVDFGEGGDSDSDASGDGASDGGGSTSAAHERDAELAARLNATLAADRAAALASSTSGGDEGAGEHGCSPQEWRWARRVYGSCVLIVSAESADDVSTDARAVFTHELCVAAPDVQEREACLTALTAATTPACAADVLRDVARKSAGATVASLRAVTAAAGIHATRQGVVAPLDTGFESGLETLRLAALSSVDAPSIPNVRWDDIGGLAHAKREILDMVQLPLEHPELFAAGMRQRSGILLFGPPGTGKTLLAKAVATECSLNFLSVKGPELLNMYIGESEKNVRAIFEAARNAKPCVLFFDELDSLAPQRGRGSDSGGVMDRVVSQLLTEVDGLQSGNDVFVIGATNRPDLLDPALLRPGRFDRLLYLGINMDEAAKLSVLKALTRKFRLADDVDLVALARACPTNFTGADFYAVCSNALAQSLKRRAAELQGTIDAHNATLSAGQPAMTAARLLVAMSDDELDVAVAMEDFHSALAQVVPSVSMAQLRYYDSLRDKFAPGDAAARAAAASH